MTLIDALIKLFWLPFKLAAYIILLIIIFGAIYLQHEHRQEQLKTNLESTHDTNSNFRTGTN